MKPAPICKRPKSDWGWGIATISKPGWTCIMPRRVENNLPRKKQLTAMIEAQLGTRQSMKLTILIASVVIVANQFSLAESVPEKEVLQFERDACKAFLDADPAALERVLTNDFTLTVSNGEVSTRANEINELRSGKVHYDVFENYGMKARLYGDSTAVVLGKTHVKGTSEGSHSIVWCSSR